MQPNHWWVIAGAVLVGHFGLNIAIYNRINATGLSRKIVKRIVRVFFVETIAVPIVVLISSSALLSDIWSGRITDLRIPTTLWYYSLICLAAWPLLGIPWLIWRPIFGLEWLRAPRTVEKMNVASLVSMPLALSAKCKLERKLPFNQIFDLAIEQIELPVAGLPAALDGYRIAQLSDIHLTGHIDPGYTQYVMERANEWQPELLAITGDIVDRRDCIEWLPQIFESGCARDGCYFVLGNHDKLVGNPQQTRDAMTRIGWTDLGCRSIRRRLREIPAELIGNEHPWLARPTISQTGNGAFRLLLSHSPDQFGWARRHNVELMLAGHTHGGQGRLPLAGPILSPSYHGSRYASGDFYRAPTTMHVSRGLSGSHVVRFRCPPELSLVILRCLADERERT